MKALIFLLVCLVCAGCSSSQPVAIDSPAVLPTKDGQPGDWGESLYYASEDAAGSRLCDAHQRRRYKEQFDRRFKSRVDTLVKAYQKQFGPASDFIVTTSCFRPLGSSRDQDRLHDAAMDKFDRWLRSEELALGLR